MTTPTPYFDARASRAEGSTGWRRLLLFSYHFPPDGAVGGLRWQKHAAYLAHHGWDVDVVARDLPSLANKDDRRLRELSSNVAIYAAREPEPVIARVEAIALFAKRRLLPGRPPRPNHAVSTKEVGVASSRGLVRALAASKHIARETAWARAAAALGEQLARANRYHAIVSSGPPHMAHEAARRVSTSLRLPLIVDFRDPWTGIERVPEDRASPVWFANARRYERLAVRDARLVVMNTDAARDDMRRRYPAAAERIVTVQNGSDAEAIPKVPRSGRFTIRFAGSIYLDRDPRPLLRAAADVARRLELTPEEFGVQFMGNVEEYQGLTLADIAAREGFQDFVEVKAPQPRSAAMEFLAGGTMLLSLPQDADLCVPAKIFEYTQFDAWLLVLASPASATARVLEDSGADVVDPNDVDRMITTIEARVLQHRRGERPRAVGADGRFDRTRQAKSLLDYLDRMSTAGSQRGA